MGSGWSIVSQLKNGACPSKTVYTIYMGQVESEQHLLTEYVLHHCKNGSVTLTQVGLSELQLHYQTMCKQVVPKKCTTVSLQLQ